MHVKYLGFADSVTFTKEDFERHEVKGKNLTFTQGEGSIQEVTAAVGKFLIEEHGNGVFAELTEENRDITNASDTGRPPMPVGSGAPAATAPVTTGDTTTPGDVNP